MRPDRRRLLRVASALATASPFIAAAQQTSAIRVLFDQASPAAADLVRTLGSRFGRVIAVNDLRQLRASPPPRFYVAIGAEALAGAAEDRLNAPVLALLASRQAYERVVRGRDDSITGIYAEPAPSNQMRLIRAVLRRRVTIGVLVSRESLSAIDMLRDAAAAHDLALHAEVYEPQLGLSRNLLRIVDAAAVLAFPDAGVYSAQNLRELLEATYRRRQPVFGFSSALVAAGTLASAVSDADDLVAQIAGMSTDIAERRMPPAQHPRYWRVAVNESVARSLNVLIDASVLRLGDRP